MLVYEECYTEIYLQLLSNGSLSINNYRFAEKSWETLFQIWLKKPLPAVLYTDSSNQTFGVGLHDKDTHLIPWKKFWKTDKEAGESILFNCNYLSTWGKESEK